MNAKWVATVAGIVVGVIGVIMCCKGDEGSAGVGGPQAVELPAAGAGGSPALWDALRMRRSSRDFSGEPLTLQEVSNLLWAAQGVSGTDGLRTAPSGGALYPLDAYLAAGHVEGLDPGVYRYDPGRHVLEPVKSGQVGADLKTAALNQGAVGSAAAVVVFASVHRRITGKYGQRGVRYAILEAGHAAQNLLLAATALELAATPMGAFEDDRVRTVAGLPPDSSVLYLVTVGRPVR